MLPLRFIVYDVSEISFEVAHEQKGIMLILKGQSRFGYTNGSNEKKKQ
jgi:hypothetical protein